VRGDPPRPVHVDGKQKPATFSKMRVTGPRCAESISEPLQAMREPNPPLNEMIRSTEQMHEVLCEAPKQPANKGRMTASSAVAIHNAYLQCQAYVPIDVVDVHYVLPRRLSPYIMRIYNIKKHICLTLSMDIIQ
jgi:hypothetical protein